ncbi:MAG TPA: hypothetical protein VGI03_11685 [Verrucomicrobiae bacterium]
MFVPLEFTPVQFSIPDGQCDVDYYVTNSGAGSSVNASNFFSVFFGTPIQSFSSMEIWLQLVPVTGTNFWTGMYNGTNVIVLSNTGAFSWVSLGNKGVGFYQLSNQQPDPNWMTIIGTFEWVNEASFWYWQEGGILPYAAVTNAGNNYPPYPDATNVSFGGLSMDLAERGYNALGGFFGSSSNDAQVNLPYETIVQASPYNWTCYPLYTSSNISVPSTFEFALYQMVSGSDTNNSAWTAWRCLGKYVIQPGQVVVGWPNGPIFTNRDVWNQSMVGTHTNTVTDVLDGVRNYFAFMQDCGAYNDYAVIDNWGPPPWPISYVDGDSGTPPHYSYRYQYTNGPMWNINLSQDQSGWQNVGGGE